MWSCSKCTSVLSTPHCLSPFPSPIDIGEVLTCGDNSAGQLGYHKNKQSLDHVTASDRAPQIVLALQDLEVIKVVCGDFYCTACCKGGLYIKLYVRHIKCDDLLVLCVSHHFL